MLLRFIQVVACISNLFFLLLVFNLMGLNEWAILAHISGWHLFCLCFFIIYLFIFGCAGSSLLRGLFSSFGDQRLCLVGVTNFSVAVRCNGWSCYGARAPGHSDLGSAVAVPGNPRRIPHHWVARQPSNLFLYITESYSTVWIYRCLSVHLWKKIWVVFQFGVNMNRPAVNSHVQDFVWMCIFRKVIPRIGIA